MKNNTELAIERWLEFYGEINKDNLKKFFGLTEKQWNKFKKKIGINLEK